MKLPFTEEQFLKIFESYNQSVWPVQIVFYVLAFLAILFACYKTGIADKVIFIILAILWFWMGIVYHLVFFSMINKAAYIFGGVFIAEGILLFMYAFGKKRVSFNFTPDLSHITALILMLFALVIYPLLAYFLGHTYPATPTFGLPCPTVIFTLGILLWAKNKIPWYLFIIPILWAITGSSAVFSLGMKEDIGLIVSALIFVAVNSTKKI